MSTKQNSARVAVMAEPCRQTDCKRIFGVEHPMDVLLPIDQASTALFQLESLFEVIAADPGASNHIKRLAEMGAYLACDFANFCDSQHEQMRNAVKKGGAQ